MHVDYQVIADKLRSLRDCMDRENFYKINLHLGGPDMYINRELVCDWIEEAVLLDDTSDWEYIMRCANEVWKHEKSKEF